MNSGAEPTPPAAPASLGASPSAPLKNSAFVFTKPHACTDATKALVKSQLESKGFTILSEKGISGEVIDEKKYIDQHYYSIASKATLLHPSELNVPADKFKAKFGLGWQEALDQGVVYNAMEACKKLNIDAVELETKWGGAKKSNTLIKFGGGFYCALIDGIYIFNGFFMSMRSKYTGDAKIHTYVIEWDADKVSWADFRGKVLGPTDPADAPAGALRAMVAQDWQALGLPGPCNTGDNAVHASASPFEAMAERVNWLEAKLSDDAFGAALIKAGIPEATINAWSVDPQVPFSTGPDGQPAGRFSLFDLLEDMDSEPCVAKCAEIYNYKA